MNEEEVRKKIWLAGALSHFSGEIAAMSLLGFKMPFDVLNHNYSSGIKDLVIGLGIYALTQPPAFCLKGICMTEDENYHMAAWHAYKYKEDKKKGRTLAQFLDRQLTNMHIYFARNHQKYDCLIRRLVTR